MPKLETKTTYFQLNGAPYPLNKCRVVIKDDNIGLSEVGSELQQIHWASPVHFSEWTDLNDTPYASKQLLLDAIGAICFI